VIGCQNIVPKGVLFIVKHNEKQKSKLKIALITAILLVLIISIGFVVYVNDYYHADDTAMSILSETSVENNSGVTITNNKNKMITFTPQNPIAGLIFYPGGKVQYESYAPLLYKLAENDILCVLVHMPCNLAVFDMNAADGIIENYPSITDWYIGGHSLGGAMAASYVEKHSDEYKGLILLAAYSTVDLTQSGLSVLSIYGSNDKVLDMDTYNNDYINLPETTSEIIIEGGCHAYFGSYGAQARDGNPTISAEEQISITANEIVNYMVGIS
jgi:hypothetical protein